MKSNNMEELEETFHSLVDKDEVSYKVVQDLNQLFRRDVRSLGKASQLVEELTEAKNELQKRLQFATTEAPDKITKAVKAAESALREGECLLQECQELQEQVEAHRAAMGSLLDELGPGIHRVCELDRVRAYQELINTVDEWSEEVGAALHTGSEGQALLVYSRLLEGASAVRGTRCTHLLIFITDTLHHWNKALTHRFSSEFEGVLKSIKWPLSGESGPHPPASPESLQRLCTLTQYLLQLTLPEHLTPAEARPPSPTLAPSFLADFEPLLLPIQLMITPLQVRFMYHFSGSRATNSRAHPEWYFTQLLKWVTAHHTFLTTRIQPVLDRCGFNNTSAKVEFMRGLVRLVTLKLATDLEEIQFEEDVLCATIQETLNFERELCLTHGYPSGQPSVLRVLTHPGTFSRWVHLERKFALELMDELVSSEDAWVCDEGGGEASKCGEQLILLLQGLTDRHKRLPQPGHRLQFLELQLDLLDDFRVRVLQVMKAEKQDPLASHYPAILNTVHHIAATLRDWADMPFFIEMQYYWESFRRAQEGTNSAARTPPSPASHPTTPCPPSPSTFPSSLTPSHETLPLASPTISTVSSEQLMREHPTPPTTAQLAEVSGSVFDETLRLYGHIKGEMVRVLASYVFSEVRARSQPYRKDKWYRSHPTYHARTPIKVTELSPSVCPLLEVLARHLHALRDVLAAPLFVKLWTSVAETLNKYMYEEVVLEIRFSETGAHQFKFDMTHGLFPIFGEFTQKPENYFRLVKECVRLLTLPRATVLLLHDTLAGGTEGVVSPHKALEELGITLLTPQEASVVLNVRIYDQE